MLQHRPISEGTGSRRIAFVLCTLAGAVLVGTLTGADSSRPAVPSTFKQYCFQCHGKASPAAGLSLEKLTAEASVGAGFQQWEKVIAALELDHMPPEGLPRPPEPERRAAIEWVRGELAAYTKQHEGDPGRTTVRRLTTGEYGYVIQDLTGISPDLGIDAASDSVGGEGFTNFGDVQFMQDSNLEHYLEAAKRISDHAVIGSGPLQFFADPGKTGFELSAIDRIQEIYRAHGIRTVSGEGGRPFGLEQYGKAMYAAWRYHHRAVLGERNVSLQELAAREGITAQFAQHIWSVLNLPSAGYPTSEVLARWRRIPVPGADAKASSAAARTACDEIQRFVVTWPSWLFARGDVAAGGAGDESPLVINEASLKVKATHHFVFNRAGRIPGGRGPVAAGPPRIYLNVAPVNQRPASKPVVLWRNATIAFRQPAPARSAQDDQSAAAQAAAVRIVGKLGPRQPLKSVVSEETARKLAFGTSADESPIGPDDFASQSSVSFEVPLPQGTVGFELQVDAEMGRDRDQVFRITISDREDGGARGIPTRTILGDPDSAGYQAFKSDFLQFVALLPPNSHSEPAPADKDPAPQPFDSTYNVPEHDEFVLKVKYYRDDRFLVEKILDNGTRRRLDEAWNDLYTSFDYHDQYLRMIAQHFNLDLRGKGIGTLSREDIETMPVEARKYVRQLRAEYENAIAAQAAARPRHLADCLDFASRAWRRPLTDAEKQSLRSFYDKTISSEQDHAKAIRALLARILVSPAFLYRVEQASVAPIKPVRSWEMANRLSFFLWSSIPDSELRRAAAAGELEDAQHIERQVKRMLADPKARRLSTEFFGQWLGFYRFDHYRGVDTGRFPEFTETVRSAMYDEAVSFFEHIIRKDRPLRELLFADYDFLNQPLAKHYGVKKSVAAKERVELVEGANAFQRGGLLRLGAILTATSAPLRTSPVKRGDWVLRRVLGTPVPPPPADAGSIPADDKLFGGLSVKDKLEAHKRNATCANCHARIDPLGFPLERYDPVGRWREQYPDGKPIYDSGELSDHTQIDGIDGLLTYLRSREDQVRRTLSSKLLGYALGRTVLASDRPLIDRLAGLGGDATFSEIAVGIATSRQFRNRADGENSTTAQATNRNLDKVGRP